MLNGSRGVTQMARRVPLSNSRFSLRKIFLKPVSIRTIGVYPCSIPEYILLLERRTHGSG